MSRSSLVLFFIGALLSSALAAVFAAYTTGDLLRHHQSTSWPTAPGTITQSEVQTYRGSKGRTRYRPVVQYSYTHQGRVHFASRIHDRRESGSSSRTSAEDRLRGYGPGQSVTVYVNPENPADAQLKPGVTDHDRAYAGLALGSVTGSLFIWTWAFFSLTRRGPGYVAGKQIIPGPPLRVRTRTIGTAAGAILAASITIAALSTLVGLTAGLSWLGLGAVAGAGLAVGVLTYWLLLNRDAKGAGDLVLDLENELVLSPKLPDSPAATTPYTAITGTHVVRAVRGSGKSRTITHEVKLSMGERAGPTVAIFSTAKLAEAFRPWLHEQLAIDPPQANAAV
jgi:hypothetical protein